MGIRADRAGRRPPESEPDRGEGDGGREKYLVPAHRFPFRLLTLRRVGLFLCVMSSGVDVGLFFLMACGADLHVL